MNSFYILSLLLIGVISTNMIKEFIPKIPEAIILIIVGVVLSFTSIFHNFNLEPEFFMLLIIAPIMFVDGQKHSFSKIRKQFGGIWKLSVILAVITALVIGTITNYIEISWSLPLSITLAAIITPTDSVAVKSITSGMSMPEKVSESIELESLFNDATGLVMLDLSLSVLSSGNFSALSGIKHFLFVSFGGVIIGCILGFLIVALRVNLQKRSFNPETTIISISLLTPFIVYLAADYLGTSGILAVVATGIVHNWESSRLKLTSTSIQLTSKTIWEIIANVLNAIVFLILGISLPEVWKFVTKIGWWDTFQLVLLGIIIYVFMLLLRYLWSLTDSDDSEQLNKSLLFTFFDNIKKANRRFDAGIFAVGGVHGTVTLAMAFSLPFQISGHAFPYRQQLIIVATTVILLSILIGAIFLPIVLPNKVEEYNDTELKDIRDKMIDYASFKILDLIPDHDSREVVSQHLQSQKNKMLMFDDDRKRQFPDYINLIDLVQENIVSYIGSEDITSKYSNKTINSYSKIIKYSFKRFPKRGRRNEGLSVRFLISNIVKFFINKFKSEKNRQKFSNFNPKYSKRIQYFDDFRKEMLNLNNDITNFTDKYLNNILKNRIDNKQSDNDYIYMVRELMNRFFDNIRHDYHKQNINVDDSVYIKAFQFEYDYVQMGVNEGHIPYSMANELYNEINQAQTLKIQENREFID
ncbi:cation:proton antiporter domain-containing protein [Apilactobacillus kunkeei]|uniref:cation:proton antiporter domain-containing protein n=1 Tax=Apilactobacillus kunkeei TaxID=148814 RepID=UPI00403467B6